MPIPQHTSEAEEPVSHQGLLPRMCPDFLKFQHISAADPEELAQPHLGLVDARILIGLKIYQAGF